MTKNQEVEVINKLGMHARAAAKFVKLASNYNSSIEIERNKQRVNGKSIMGVMMLAASKGTIITIHASGEDADDAVKKLVDLVKDKFGEDE